jgi:hypothetical protein
VRIGKSPKTLFTESVPLDLIMPYRAEPEQPAVFVLNNERPAVLVQAAVDRQ